MHRIAVERIKKKRNSLQSVQTRIYWTHVPSESGSLPCRYSARLTLFPIKTKVSCKHLFEMYLLYSDEMFVFDV